MGIQTITAEDFTSRCEAAADIAEKKIHSMHLVKTRGACLSIMDGTYTKKGGKSIKVEHAQTD